MVVACLLLTLAGNTVLAVTAFSLDLWATTGLTRATSGLVFVVAVLLVAGVVNALRSTRLPD